jgi:uncharacterized protein YdhG (YjbR/CyaY superfamily)
MRKTSTQSSSAGKFTSDERAAMKARVQEMKAEARMSKDPAAGEKAVLAAIAKMPEPDRTLAKRVHAIVTASAPALSPKTWYGMPAYAQDDKVVCYLRPAHKFKDRYATFGFNDKARLDDGAMWPTSYALTKLTAAEEKRIRELVQKAAG